MAAPRNPRVSLTPAQIAEGIGAELFTLCADITADGKLSKDEVVALGTWLEANRSADLPGVAYIAGIFGRIIADGRVTREESAELLEALEKVLPAEHRKEAVAARKAVERERKIKARDELKAAQAELKATERESKERAKEAERALRASRAPEDFYSFMVKGVPFEGRHKLIERHLNAGDRVRLEREPGNRHDRNAVKVTLFDGRQIGYVPRDDAPDVGDSMGTAGGYTATVKKIIGYTFPVPIISASFYRPDQLDAVADLAPDPCVPPARPASRAGEPGRADKRRPWWKFW